MLMRSLLAAAVALALLGSAAPAPAQVWVPAWTASAMPERGDLDRAGEPLQFADQTVRQDLQLASAASAIRIRFSNELGAAPLVLGEATAGLRGGPVTPVQFNGASAVTIPVGASLLSDPIPLDIPAFADLTVSVYLPEPTRPAVRLTAVRVGPGRDAVPDSVRLERRQSVISAILAERETAPAAVIVAFGDSLTEGNSTTLGANKTWPSQLARRLEARCPGEYVVLNAGIGGNMVASNGRSPSALARLDRDVLSLPGITHLILLEGLNDIRQKGTTRDRAGAPAETVIAGYGQIIDRLRLHEIEVLGGLLTPILAVSFEPVIEGPSTDDKRRALNAFIRDAGAFDAVVDFDTAIQDPAHPERIRPGAHREDGYHPNDEGHRLMAEAVDLSLFGCGSR
ncbi:MAG: SGNH/GDSL hydrolase family protein [Brevundimonas sp.]|nr:SGNH/GDSL hydrolase family protein [Brevundimonas sp.]